MLDNFAQVLALTWFQLLLIPCAFIVGGLCKGALGFGLPFVTVSIVPLFAPLEVALAVNAVVLPIANFLQFTRDGLIRSTLDRHKTVVLGILIGAPIGAYLLDAMAIQIIELVLGVFVMCFVVLTLYNPSIKVPQRKERRLGLGVGLFAGVIGTMTTVNGPFFIMYLLGLKIDRSETLAALGLLFVVSGACFLLFFGLFGILTVERFQLGIVCSIFAIIGMWLGDRIVRYVDRDFFRRLVLSGLFILGLNIFLRGLT
ncbi:MAG: sulfite exporter TauE/SafE family protein [Pseudomonadota bacterium]